MIMNCMFLLLALTRTPPHASTEKRSLEATAPAHAQSKAVSRARTSLAIQWADAFRRRDVDGLIKLTSFPFAVRDTGTADQCASGTAPDKSELEMTLSCMMSVGVLHDDMVALRTLESRILSKRSIPKWARRWGGELPADVTPVSIPVPGNGASHEFILLVGTDGVRGVWKTTWFDSN
jgi:hypothetical protein